MKYRVIRFLESSLIETQVELAQITKEYNGLSQADLDEFTSVDSGITRRDLLAVYRSIVVDLEHCIQWVKQLPD